ncbi:MAG: hypothetical protein F6K14_34520 [Symploca sp. SIO2C1]|nr:hypothetical protein [Symploca sp. SIO2C1]
MSVTEQISDIIKRIAENKQTDADIQVLQEFLKTDSSQVVQQLGKYNVNIGQGQNIHIGDRIYHKWDKEAMRAIIEVIQGRWRRVASITENDYTQVGYTGIGFIDEAAKKLTDISQQFMMRYGLKLAFSPNPNQEYFISAGNQTIKRWHKPKNSWELLQEIPVIGNLDLWFTSVAISPNAQLFAACKAYQIKIWRLGEANALHHLSKTLLSNPFDVSGFDSVTFSPNGKILAANDNQDIQLWDVITGKEIVKLSAHKDKVTCIAFYPDNGRILASCSYDKTIKIWDIDSKKCLNTFVGHRDAVYTLAFSPDGKKLASGSDDNTIKLWNLNGEKTPQTLRQHGNAVTCLVFSPNGKTLMSGSNDGTIIEWKITEKEPQILTEQHRRGVTSIALSPDGKTLISAGRDQTIKIWQRLTG